MRRLYFCRYMGWYIGGVLAAVLVLELYSAALLAGARRDTLYLAESVEKLSIYLGAVDQMQQRSKQLVGEALLAEAYELGYTAGASEGSSGVHSETPSDPYSVSLQV